LSLLLDTNAISEIIKTAPDPGFMSWFAGLGDGDGDLNISVLTIGEMRRGALKLAEGQRRALLDTFISQTVAAYGSRVMPIDLPVIEAWSELAERYRRAGVVVGFTDELIAATAIAHDLTVVTRNVRHFEHSGCRVLSPWSA
jgi:toxin FitB